MISRRTTLILADIFNSGFTKKESVRDNRGTTKYKRTPLRSQLYDYLYEHGYEPWLCNMTGSLSGERAVKKFIMQLHTGETQFKVTAEWSSEQRKRLGQRMLRDLAKDIMNTHKNASSRTKYSSSVTPDQIDELKANLELDGYIYRDGHLLYSESAVFDVGEETGILEGLYNSLKLSNKDLALYHLKLSERHYLENLWDDSISNARKFLEVVLQEVAGAHSLRVKGAALSAKTLEEPVAVRDYLETERLLEAKEKKALGAVYALLSHTGGHPYMAQSDQARLLRHLALTFSQFVMLRVEGALKSTSSP